MTGEPTRPARVITWLLAICSSREAADATAGDVLEELAQRSAAGRRPRWAMLYVHARMLHYTCAAAAMTAQRTARTTRRIVRDAARALRTAPAHSLFILVVLATGISAATVTFSVVDAVMLKPLPFDRSDEIVVIGGRNALAKTRLSHEEFWAVHDHAAGLDSIAPMMSWHTVMADRPGAELVVHYTTADIFRVLRLKPLIGRLWTADEEARGDNNSAVIGYGLWQSRFRGDPAVLGQSVQVPNEPPYRIVGVLPPDAIYPTSGRSPIEMWAPRVPSRTSDPNRGSIGVYPLGRLKDGVSSAHAQAEIERLLRGLNRQNPSRDDKWRPEVQRWDDSLTESVGETRGWLLLLLGAVTLIVLIACFNAANLTLARSVRRARELAVRAALGASRWQLGATLLAESLMLSLLATLCGLAFASWGVHAVTAALPMALFRGYDIHVDGRVFVAGIAAALATGIIFGTLPAWQAGRVSVVTLLKDGGATTTGSRRSWRSAFLTAQVACVCILLVVSTLFVTSFIRVTALDLGFDRSNLIAVATVTDYQGTADDVKARFASIPGVTGVAAVTNSSPPLIGSAFGGAWAQRSLRPASAPGGGSADVELYRVSPDYFEVAGISFRRGSTWASSAADAMQPMVIDEHAARTMFGDRNPLGGQVADEKDQRVFTIVGVVPFVFARGPEGSPRSSAYIAMRPNSTPSWVSFLLRTSSPAASLVPAVQETLDSLSRPDPEPSAGAGVRIVDDGYRRLTAARRFNAGLMTAFGVFALLIGAAGIYAVTASIVAQQTREIGVRVALGATSRDIRHGVLTLAGRHVSIGLALGLPVAWWISRAFASLFFQVGPADPSIYLIVIAIVGAVSALAAIVPAHRASRVDPIRSLRIA